MYAEAAMIRKQVYIEPHQERRLKARAKLLGVTEAEIIRQSLERGLGEVSPQHPDPAAWARIARYIQTRRTRSGRRPVKAWRRGELYAR
jgi:hypothetical protein